MIKIIPPHNLNDIVNNHYNMLYNLSGNGFTIKSRLKDELERFKLKRKPDSKKYFKILSYIDVNIESIIKGDSSILEMHILAIKNIAGENNFFGKFCEPKNKLKDSQGIIKSIKYIFNYELFSSGIQRKKQIIYSAEDLLLQLKIEICPYCNRAPTDSIKNILVSDIDHFFLVKNYPYLALSFYNLIPSCTPCNSRLKLTKDCYQTPHSNPYQTVFQNSLLFHSNNFYNNPIELEFIINDNYNDFDQEIINSRNNIQTFKLIEIYQNKKKRIDKIVNKYKEIEGSYLNNRNSFYSQFNNLTIGNKYSELENNFGKLDDIYITENEYAKFTRDILISLDENLKKYYIK